MGAQNQPSHRTEAIEVDSVLNAHDSLYFLIKVEEDIDSIRQPILDSLRKIKK